MHGKFKYLFLSLITVIICTTAAFSSVEAAESAMPSAGTPDLRVVDISQWNDDITTTSDEINFAVLAKQVDAVYIRAFGNSNGVPYIDKQAANFANSAQKENLLYGFYYYYDPKTPDLADARSQAQAYYSFVKNYAYSCVPVLDVEGDSSNQTTLSPAELYNSIKAFSDEFKSLSGFDLMIYSYPNYIFNHFDPSLNWTTYKLWIANYNVSAPMALLSATAYSPITKTVVDNRWCWERWDIWQYTSTGTLSSIPRSSGGALCISYATDNILLSTPTSQFNLDTPSIGSISGGDFRISGWALSHSGISRVDIYADNGKWIGSTSTIYSRPDVQNIMNSNGRYNDGIHSGFSYNVDASKFTPGEHTLGIAVINRNGTVDWYGYPITVGPDSQICLDAPTSNITGGDVTVSGWALSHAGISRVDIYLDDYLWAGSTNNLFERYDVNSIINSEGLFKDGVHSGFSHTIDAGSLTIGSHIVRVAAISKDGSVQWIEKEFTVGPASQICLDSPSNDKIIGGDVNVRGWALSHAGISRVDIYLDDYRWVGSTPNMYARWDVNSIINKEGLFKDGLNSGFSYTIDANSLSIGSHVVRVAAISKDGSVQWTESEFTVGPESQLYLDTPLNSVTSGSDVTVSGWALSHAGISRVDIYLDNYSWVGSTPNLYERWDVNNIINSDGLFKDGLHSGFSYIINASSLTKGTHIVKVAAISNDGSVQWIEKYFNIE